jgi:hypothetical protein
LGNFQQTHLVTLTLDHLKFFFFKLVLQDLRRNFDRQLSALIASPDLVLISQIRESAQQHKFHAGRFHRLWNSFDQKPEFRLCCGEEALF